MDNNPQSALLHVNVTCSVTNSAIPANIDMISDKTCLLHWVKFTSHFTSYHTQKGHMDSSKITTRIQLRFCCSFLKVPHKDSSAL